MERSVPYRKEKKEQLGQQWQTRAAEALASVGSSKSDRDVVCQVIATRFLPSRFAMQDELLAARDSGELGFDTMRARGQLEVAVVLGFGRGELGSRSNNLPLPKRRRVFRRQCGLGFWWRHAKEGAGGRASGLACPAVA